MDMKKMNELSHLILFLKLNIESRLLMNLMESFL